MSRELQKHDPSPAATPRSSNPQSHAHCSLILTPALQTCKTMLLVLCLCRAVWQAPAANWQFAKVPAFFLKKPKIINVFKLVPFYIYFKCIELIHQLDLLFQNMHARQWNSRIEEVIVK